VLLGVLNDAFVSDLITGLEPAYLCTVTFNFFSSRSTYFTVVVLRLVQFFKVYISQSNVDVLGVVGSLIILSENFPESRPVNEFWKQMTKLSIELGVLLFGTLYVRQKVSPKVFFAIFSTVARNFEVKFCTFRPIISCSYSRKSIM